MSSTTLAQDDSVKAIDCFTKGVELYSKGLYQEALTKLEESEKLMDGYEFDDLFGRVWYFIGDCCRLVNNADKGEKYLLKAEDNFLKYGFIDGLGYVYKSLGDIYFTWGMTIKAEDNYNQSLSILKKGGEPLVVGLILNSLGNIYLNRGENDTAAVLLNESLTYYDKANSDLGKGEAWYGFGLVAVNKGNNSEAKQHFLKAMGYFDKAGYEIGKGNVYYGLGIAALNQGENQEALTKNLEAIEIYKQFNYTLGLGNAYWNLGTISLNLSKYEDSQKYNMLALQYYVALKYLLGEGNVYQNIAALSLNTGDHNKAVEYYYKGLECHEKAGYTLGVGKCYQGLAAIFLNTGDNKKSEENCKKAIEYFELAGFKSGIGNIYELLATLSMNSGNMEKSEEFLKKALIYYEAANFPIGMGNVHYTLAQIYLSDEKYEKAIAQNQMALVYYQKAEYVLGIGNVYYNLGQVVTVYEGDLEKIKKYNKLALAEYQKANYSLGLGKVAFSLGFLEYFDGNYLKAEVEYSSALKYFTDSEYNFFAILASFALSEVYMQQGGKSMQALQKLKEGIGLLEKFRSNLVREEDRRNFYEKFSFYLQYSVNSAISLKEPQLAFRYLENIKSRTLNELLTERSINLTSKINAEVLVERNLLDNIIAKIKTELNTNPGEGRDSLKSILKKYEDSLDKLIFELRTNNPAFASIEYPKPVTTDDLQSVLNQDDAILQYFLYEDNSYLFLTTKENFEIIPIGASRDSISNFGGLLLDGLRRNKFNKSIPKSEMDFEEETSYETAKALYNLLIKPIEPKLSKNSKLIIVPDGVLNLIPFEVLVSDTSYLVEKYPIKYFQSAALLTLMRTSLRKEHKSSGFIGFGDPVYDLENFNKGTEERGIKLAQRGGGLYEDFVEGEFSRAGLTLFRLKATGEEINSIAEIFKGIGEKVEIKLRKDANEGNAKSGNLKDYRYISFACHGLINPGFQSLALASEDSLSRKEDGFLTFEEILNLDWDAELVVLSACETGTGELKKTEGIIGLTRAVMYAGADAVAVSLWNVSDKGTKDLMINFFDNIVNKKLTKDEAIQQAKISFIHKGISPYYWSPFVIYGE